MKQPPVSPIQQYDVDGKAYFRPVRCITGNSITLAIKLPTQKKGGT